MFYSGHTRIHFDCGVAQNFFGSSILPSLPDCRCQGNGKALAPSMFRAGFEQLGKEESLQYHAISQSHKFPDIYDTLSSCYFTIDITPKPNRSHGIRIKSRKQSPSGNIAWASASLGFNPSNWISEVVGSYADRQFSAVESESCSPQAVANLLWSTLVVP